MFSNIGWSEIGVIIVVAIIVIGPERLPGLLQDFRAAIFAARKAINNAKQELNGEFEEFSSDFEQFREPLHKVSQLSRMGPRAAIAKTLFDEDDEFFNQFDPRTILKEQGPNTAAAAATDTASRKPQNVQHRQPQQRGVQSEELQSHPPQTKQSRSTQARPAKPQQEQPRRAQPPAAGGGRAEFTWTDVL